MEIKMFTEYLRLERRSSEHTVKSYETDLLQFRDFICGNSNSIPVCEYFTDKNVRMWMMNLSQNVDDEPQGKRNIITKHQPEAVEPEGFCQLSEESRQDGQESYG